MKNTKEKIRNYSLMISVMLSIVVLSSFKKPAVEYVNINGDWENFTVVKDENGKERKKDGEKIYRKIKLTFVGAGTVGAADGIKEMYGMSDASGKVNFVESFGLKEKKYKNKDDQEIMNYGLQVQFRKAHCGYFYDDENLNLKISCGGMKILDQKTNKFVEYKKGEANFTAFQDLVSKVKLKKITKKQMVLEWDYNLNGTIEADETLVFDSVD